MKYIVTYRFDKENDLWKTTKFTDREKAEDYYNNIKLFLNDIVYFGTIVHDKENSKLSNTLIWCEKKYKISYFKGQYYNSKIETVVGKLINYDSPFTGRFFIENDNGALEIIPMASVVEMREIVE